MKKTLTIVLTGGGSGGHITPLLSLAHALKARDPVCKVVYIGLKNEPLKDDLRQRFRVFDEVYTIPSGKFRRYHGESVLAHLVDVKTLLLNIRDFFRVIGGIYTATRLLKRVKPDVVFSKGGFVVVPVGIAAHLQHIPIITHDSDTVPGLANRIIGRWAKIRTSGMPVNSDKAVKFVGIPLDERIKPVTDAAKKAFKKELGLPADSLVLLVGGAGLGSRDVNNSTIRIAPELLKRFDELVILQFTGPQHEKTVKDQYEMLGKEVSDRVRVIGFASDFYKYTGAADLVITRAGATTIAELAAQSKTVILIPAAQLTGGHQLKNAEELKNRGAVEVVGNDAPPEKLLEKTSELLGSTSLRNKLAQKIGESAKTDASERLAEILLTTAAGNEVKARNAS